MYTFNICSFSMCCNIVSTNFLHIYWQEIGIWKLKVLDKQWLMLTFYLVNYGGKAKSMKRLKRFWYKRKINFTTCQEFRIAYGIWRTKTILHFMIKGNFWTITKHKCSIKIEFRWSPFNLKGSERQWFTLFNYWWNEDNQWDGIV